MMEKYGPPSLNQEPAPPAPIATPTRPSPAQWCEKRNHLQTQTPIQQPLPAPSAYPIQPSHLDEMKTVKTELICIQITK